MNVQSLFRDTFSGTEYGTRSLGRGFPRIVTNVLSLVGAGILAYYAVANTFAGATVMAVLDASALILIVASAILQRFAPLSVVPAILGVLAVCVLFFYLFLLVGPSRAGYLWFFVLPPLCLFVLGPSLGTIFFLAVYAVLCVVCLGVFPELTPPYGAAFISRFLVALFVNYVFCVGFELARWRAFTIIETKNREQSETLREVKQLSDELAESEALHRALIERANDGIVLLVDDVIRMLNEKMARMLGYASADLIGRNYSDFVAAEERDRLHAIHLSRLAGEPAPELYETVLLHQEGYKLPVEISAGLIHFDRSPADFVVVRDISSRKKLQDELRYLAYHDVLTGLGNRKGLYERLSTIVAAAIEARRPSVAAILYLDLDGFKKVNDTFGHATGDGLLQAVGRRIQEQVRSSDDVYRIGGDEFVVVVASLSRPEDAGAIAAKLVQSIARPYVFGEIVCTVTTSVGVCPFDAASADVDQLLHSADQAMFLSKREKNRFTVALTPKPDADARVGVRNTARTD